MNISSKIIWSNRSGDQISWFHPRACVTDNPGHIFMTLQRIGGSDFYGPLHQSVSFDGGHSWSNPEPVPGCQWKPLGNGIHEGICDVVPEYHAPTRTILAIGHNVYYKDGALFDSLGDWSANTGPQLNRFPVWGIRDSEGKWIITRKKLEIPECENCMIYSCGSSQRLFQGEDEALIPFTCGKSGIRERNVFSALFHYDGKELTCIRRGNTLHLPFRRGLLEPSIIRWKDRCLLTMRAEDGCGYRAESEDGLTWQKLMPWSFDDGNILETSTTQQHFLELGGRLFLIYTRNAGTNSHIWRFRAPLYIAEVNDDFNLVRSSEQIVFPMIPEGDKAAGMGNFHPAKLDERRAIVTVGEERYFQEYHGDTLCAMLQL